MNFTLFGRRVIASTALTGLSRFSPYVTAPPPSSYFTNPVQVSGFTDVSVLFVGISGVDLGLHSSDADMLWGQIIMSTVQECVYDHEGAVS